VTSEVPSSRIFFFTCYKCGSQWVRDVLTSPEMMASSGGLQYHVGGLDASQAELSGIPAGTLSGPLYGFSAEAWESVAAFGDRALVVLRDPRDIVVSWVYSAAYSHRENELFKAIREPLLRMDTTQRMLMFAAWFGRLVGSFRSWTGRRDSGDEMITSYERLVAHQTREFSRIVDFFGWRVPADSLQRVLERHSFETRSGRRRGEENTHSHFRQGEPGDWRRHFDSTSGLYFERVAPGLLAQLGYEDDPEWYARLPSTPSVEVGGKRPDLGALLESHRLAARVAALEEENRQLRRICEERLELIERLSDARSEAPQEAESPTEEA
jgi:hypothetical protein